MYLSVQKIKGKLKRYGHPIGVVTYQENIGTTTYYRWKYTDEKFERPNISYKFVVKESYRDHGKVKQRQLCLGTIFWFEFMEERQELFTEWNQQKIREKFNPTAGQMKQLEKDCNKAVDKIEDGKDFKWVDSREFRTFAKYNNYVVDWKNKKEFFDKQYGEGYFEQVYDFYCNVRNKSLLKQLEKDKQEKDKKENEKWEAEKRFYQEAYDRVWEEQKRRILNKGSQFSNEEKGYLKQFYRTLAKNYHPDLVHDDGEAMKFLNKLKDQWGV